MALPRELITASQARCIA